MVSGKLKSFRIALAALALITVQPVSATLVTLTGTNVIYEYDSGVNADALALLGTPAIIGDAVRFLPPSLRAQSLDGEGLHTASVKFNFSSVRTVGNAEISSIQLLEFGDYDISGDGNVGAELAVAISNNADSSESIQDIAIFSAAGATNELELWRLESTLNPADSFGSIASDISLTFGNTLTAESNEFGQSAWIQKKLSFVASTTQALSEPGSLAPFAFGLMGVLAIGRRRIREAR